MPGLDRRLILMGLRGSGKSTLGRLLAERVGCAFADLDDLTTERLGFKVLREAWDAVGEPAFRKGESAALGDQLDLGDPFVLALGGGTPTAPGADELLLDASGQGAMLVYLRGSPKVLRDRLATAENADRPSLTGAGVLHEIEQVLAARDPLYRELAHQTLEIDGMSIKDLMDALLEIWDAS